MLHVSQNTSARLRAALAILVVCAALACAAARSQQTDSEVEITLLSINDFHGALVHGGVDPSTGRPWGGAVALAEQVRRQRDRRPQRTFLFDAGDEMQGTPESNLLFGRSSVEVLNRLGVDAAALGNHEFDWGVDTLRARVAQMQYPMLAANVFEKSDATRPTWLRPTTMLERDGVRIGVIGLITSDTPRVTLPLNVSHLHFAPADSGVSALAQELRDAGADIVIALGHLGGTQREDGCIEGPLAELAHKVRGVDAVIGGHRHTVVSGHVAGVPVVSAASRGRALGRVTLFWDGARVTRSDVTVLSVYADSTTGTAANGIPAYVDSIHRLVQPLMERVIANAPRRFSEEALANLVADAMRAAAGADIALTNIGGIRSDLPAGPVTVGDLFEIVPFENTLVLSSLSGRQLRACLETRLSKARVSGLRGRIDTAAPHGARLVDLRTAAGGAFDDTRTYRVVTNNFIAQGGDGFVGFLGGDDVQWTEILVRDALGQWIETQAGSSRHLSVENEKRLLEDGTR